MIISLLLLQHNFHGFSVEIFYVLSLFLLSAHCMFSTLELTLQEFLVRTEEFRRKKYQLNEHFVGRDKIRTSNLYMFSFRFPCLVVTANYFSKNPTFEIINYHFSYKIVCNSLFVLDFCRNFSQKVEVRKNRFYFKHSKAHV